ncbi:MAG: hypothetical protein O3A00_23645 [Planctomycetota bacterium]|nr:hypothetical protein [Planctomycetota bacterium]
MFGFIFRKKQDEVRKLLQNRMNRSFLRQFRYGKRIDPRGSFCEVVWIIPYDDAVKYPDFTQGYPAVTKDISPEGLSLIHTLPIRAKRVLVALEGASETRFVACTHTHSTNLGYGYYQIGLHPEEVLWLDESELNLLRKSYVEQVESRREVAVPC